MFENNFILVILLFRGKKQQFAFWPLIGKSSNKPDFSLTATCNTYTHKNKILSTKYENKEIKKQEKWWNSCVIQLKKNYN